MLLLGFEAAAEEAVPSSELKTLGKVGTIVHTPLQPKPGESVLITATLSPKTVKATFKLQAVAPGKYIRKSDPAYEKDWTELPMQAVDQENPGKAIVGIFNVRVPATYQRHRWLVRYRIVATDGDGKSTQLPAPDDTCPNYTWWCNAGVAAWTGSREPGKSPSITYSSDFLNTLQSLSLLTQSDDVAQSQWDGNFHKKKMEGTIVYRGVVYDHIQFSNRGQGSAHISGKNKWNLKFNHGHELPFLDHNDKPFPEPCHGLNLNPGGSTPYLPVHRGISGLDEVLSMRAYRLAGVPSPPATWVQWRVIESANEVDPRDQYQGDLWGLYVAIGDIKPKLLTDHKLPDGLTVSTQSGIKHVPHDMTDGTKLWEKFLTGMRSNPNETWWRNNLNLQVYFSFHALNRLLGNVDLRPDGNHGYYRHPDGHWSPIPWDNDMMFVPRHHQPGTIEAIGCLNHPKIMIEYRNRAREILDLFAADGQDGGGQIGQLTSDLGMALTPKGFQVDWPRLDEACWSHHPRMNQKGSYFINPSSADHFGGRWTRTLATNNFAGFRQYIVDFCTDTRPTKNYAPNDGDQRGYGWGYLYHEAKDDKIPVRPSIELKPRGKYLVKASAFVSPCNNQAETLEWRVGRIGQIGWYELAEHWRGETKSGDEINIPLEVFKTPGRYHVRARWRDQTQRCSHWSLPLDVKIDSYIRKVGSTKGEITLEKALEKLKEVNPGGKLAANRDTNCANCALATYHTLRGNSSCALASGIADASLIENAL